MRLTEHGTRLRKGLIIFIGLKSKVMSQKYKNARYSIGNVSNKDFSNIIREFEKLPYESYENIGANMSIMIANFTCQDRFRNV